jgi:hypothetical protein
MRFPASPTSVELAAALLDQTEQHLVMAGHRLGAGGPIRARQTPAQPSM